MNDDMFIRNHLISIENDLIQSDDNIQNLLKSTSVESNLSTSPSNALEGESFIGSKQSIGIACLFLTSHSCP